MRPRLAQPWLIVIQLCLLLLAAQASVKPDRTAASTPATEAQEEDDGLPSNDFTEAQLARASERMSRLFDDSMDANKDGKLTKPELKAWLDNAAREQADKDLEETWRMYTRWTGATGSNNNNNNNNSSHGDSAENATSLDWESFANARAAAAAESTTDEAGELKKLGQATAEVQAEVRRAIEEASRETGLDKAGIKVSVPEAATPQPKGQEAAEDDKAKEARRQQQQRQLALELAKDRRRWEAADADGDGRLSRREFADFALAEPPSASSPAVRSKMRQVLALEALERMDADGDGRVSLSEFLAGGAAADDPAATAADRVDEEKNFRDTWDANRDGFLDALEVQKMLDTLDSAAAAGDGGDDADAAAAEAERLVRAADTDGDGSLSKAEVLASLTAFTGSAATGYGDAVGIHDEL